MRSTYFGLAIAAIAALGPMQVWGGDREIAEQIIKRLKVNRDQGALKDFTLDMKVDNGVVVFRGNVSQAGQKDLVLKTADGLEGIERVIDEVTVTAEAKVAQAPVDEAKLVRPAKTIAKVAKPIKPPAMEAETSDSGFSFSQAVAAMGSSEDQNLVESNPVSKSPVKQADMQKIATQQVVPGEVRPTAAVELDTAPLANNDQKAVSSVIEALGNAQRSGQLRGFGVDVTSNNGVVTLKGRAASEAQRNTIIEIANRAAAGYGVEDLIRIPASQSVQADLAPAPNRVATASVPAQTVAHRQNAQAQPVPYRMNQQHPMQAQPAGYGMGAPTMGQPVPMAPYSGGGAPRYDTPNLPNYAWPGYSAHPNYAALTYPQQYSPSAWPYIGPFYPYPQVPLGWRKVSLEWDDGWWFLDFTDK
ncbi:periplasmic protein [Novipirellula aureliae]|uniref:Periplasmic protein n=1 Tax=Novipirellula aureliae TaxID=2527966 RepID=A0A5C6E294_9BACT|nr:BON domain-containing protein [Novipirellula aureliae]TWU42978.1 periplasmic protein [Novipirellula aureliae]